jgi:cellulose synthase/poly-beta-1,6-N-acetylglucosamine synthase-like glycosyltransferase
MISFVIISKDEPLLADTLNSLAAQRAELGEGSEVVVVDASAGRLEHIHTQHPECVWIDFQAPIGVGVTIPHQRNHGVRAARGDVIVFTDSGCLPAPGWASTLVAPILAGTESVTTGRTIGRGSVEMYDALGAAPPDYVDACPTINMAFTRAAFECADAFDESFAYGSDVDFSWRLHDAGYRIRTIPEAVVTADWGSSRRQLKRAWVYGRARARLYSKHRGRLRAAWRKDPVPLVYGAFLLGLPLARRFPAYLALLLIPALRNRRTGPLLTVADHLVQGAGFLRELAAR